MIKKIVYFCSVIIAVGGAWICLSGWWKSWRIREYAYGHGLGYMHDARKCIYLNIQAASFSAPLLFVSTVGNGLMVTSTNLPPVIMTNAIWDASQVAFLDLDMWHHPYNISILPFTDQSLA